MANILINQSIRYVEQNRLHQHTSMDIPKLSACNAENLILSAFSMLVLIPPESGLTWIKHVRTSLGKMFLW